MLNTSVFGRAVACLKAVGVLKVSAIRCSLSLPEAPPKKTCCDKAIRSTCRVSGKASLLESLGHKMVSGELHKQIKRLLEIKLIEMTIPENPNSRLQKYRLTEAGMKLLSTE